MSRIFENKLDILGIHLTEKQKKQFATYYDLLIDWNKVMNLTGITEKEEVNEKHFVDSLSVVKAVEINSVENLIDIGTGAGFPGIPLKIAFPNIKITLLDSLNKRIKFLNTVIDTLKLDGITTIHGRAEDYAKMPEYREQYDICVSRAVANLSTLAEYCLPYVKTGGMFIPYKSGNIDDELQQSQNALHLLGGRIDNVIKFQLPDSEISRSFVNIKKERTTPKRYPRKAGQPAKEPL